MQFTFKELVEKLSSFVGKAGACWEDSKASDFAISILQEYILLAGDNHLSKWCITACDNCITLPEDLAVPLKAKVDGKSINVISKWYEYNHRAFKGDYDCCNIDLEMQGAVEQIGSYPTVYDLPGDKGYKVIVKSVLPEKKGYVIIQGLGTDNHPIYTNGEEGSIKGEKIYLNNTTWIQTKNLFKTVTGIIKSPTCSYVDVNYIIDGTTIGFLAHLNPETTNPEYSRIRLNEINIPCPCCYTLTVVGRYRAKKNYHPDDKLPIDDLNPLVNLARARQAVETKDLQVAQYERARAIDNIELYGNYKKTGDDPIQIPVALSYGRTRRVF